MVIHTKEKRRQKRNVVQLSVFVLPKEKQIVIKKAEEEGRTISNYCKMKILGGLQI